MKSIVKRIYFNRDKEDNWELEKELKNKKFNTENILYLGYEICMRVELFEDGTNRVLSIDGVNVSDKNIGI